MGKPKASKTKMSLGDFLGDDTGGTSSWADEMDSMPTAPGEFADVGFKRPGYGGGERMGFGASRDDSRPPRPDVPFPTEPPYTAFVGNMSFECSQEDVKDFFTNEGLSVTNVRMVMDFNGRPKGFCYVEFPEADMLRHALTLTNTQLAGRTIRVSVAEPPRGDSAGRSDGAWTRSGPLPDIPGRSGMSSRPRDGGFPDREPVGDSGRDWGDARGSKFTPSVPTSPSMGSRSGFGGPGAGAGRDMSGPRMGMGANFREAAPIAAPAEDRDWGAARGGRFTPSAPAPASTGGRPGFGSADRKPSQPDEARDWRARASPMSPALSESGSSSGPAAATAAAPVERKRLQLAARSVPATSSATDTTATSSTAESDKPNPFGGARPVNTAAREAAVQEKLEKERAEAEAKRAAIAADGEAARKSSNPFGAAKPVDVAEREREVEAKLAKEKEELEKRLREAKISDTAASDSAEGKSAAPAAAAAGEKPSQQREWRRPAGQQQQQQSTHSEHRPHQQQPRRGNSSSSSATSPPPSSSSSAPGAKKPPAAPRQISKNQGIRKEGFSYSSIASARSAPAEANGAAQTNGDAQPDEQQKPNGEAVSAAAEEK